MEKKITICIVDDEHIVRESLFHWFSEEGYDVGTADSGEAFLEIFEKGKYELVLVDMKMTGMSGLDLLIKIKEIDSAVVVILITAFASISSAIKALQNGAYDYITKPIDPNELTRIVEKAILHRALQRENVALKDKIDEITKPDNLIGQSKQMEKIFSLINTVASSDTTVMIRGESGTGKELVAKAIHLNSSRKYNPFISVACCTLNSNLSNDLLGIDTKKGKFEMANGGTIFLDEISSWSPIIQEEIFKIIETKQFKRIGRSDIITSDFRIIAATNEPLEELVKTGKFREDLYFRLNMFSIVLPPLRDRTSDVPVLANYFLKTFLTSMNKRITSISSEAMDLLINHSWHGNVRELRNAIERAVVVNRTETIQPEDLPFQLSYKMNVFDGDDKSLSGIEKRYIAQILSENNWNISKTAKILNIDRVTLYNKIARYGMKKNEDNK